MRWSHKVGNGSAVQNFEAKTRPELHTHLYTGSGSTLQRTQWDAAMSGRSHPGSPSPAPPTKSSLEPPLPRGASPGLGRWALDVGAGGSYFHASAQRPWPPIRQAAALNFQRREADSQPRTPATSGTCPPAPTSSPLPTDITFVSRPPLSSTLTSPPGHR